MIESVHRAIDGLADLDPRMLTGAELEEAERQVFAARARLDELAARLVPAAEELGLPKEAGTTSTTAWLARVSGVSKHEASRTVKAGRLMPGVEATRREWAAGWLSTDKALIIATAIDTLPETHQSDDERRDAEATLLGFARQFDAHDLQRLANAIIEVIDPDGADDILGEQLEQQEKKAWDATQLSISRLKPGTSKITAVLPDAQADMLRTACEALAAPRRNHLRRSDEGEFADLPHTRKVGVAFCELIEHLPTDKLPVAGGTSATLTVNVDLETLKNDIGTATLSSGTRVSASEARRLACGASIIPLVLDGASRILDHGSAKRLHDRRRNHGSGEARRQGSGGAAPERDEGARPGHHLVPFDSGGPTSIDNGALFCGFHHRLLHAGDWTAHLAPDGVVGVVPPARVDPQRRPRRHVRHTQLHPVAA